MATPLINVKPIVKPTVPATAGKAVNLTSKATTTTKPVATKPVTTTTPTKPTTPVTPAQPAFDQAAYLKQQQDAVNAMYNQIQQQQIAALQAQQQKAINDINYQKQQVDPQYQGMKNQADVTNLQNAKKLQETMASNGLNASGENVTAMVGQNAARQKSLNDLNLQEQQTLNDFNHQIADANDPAQMQQLLATLGQQKAQALYDAQNKANDRAYQVGRDNVADNQWNQQFNYQKSRDTTADNQWNQQFKYQQSRDKTSDSQWNQQFNYQKSQDKLDNAYRNQQLLMQKDQFKTTQDWQKYVYNHVSATDKAQLDANIKQYGETAAFNMFQLQTQQQTQLAENNANINYYSNAGFNTSSKGSGPVTGSYSNTINSAAKVNGVNPGLVKAVAMQESSLGKTSNNVMQVNGMSNASPEASIAKGTQMLGGLIKKTGGNIQEALAAYNMGEGILSYFNSHGGYSVQNMINFSNMQKQQHGYKKYGDPYYVQHVLQYYK